MRKEILADTLKRNKSLFLLFAVTTAVNLCVFLLYRIMTEAFFYAEAIIFSFFVVILVADYVRTKKRVNMLESAKMSLKNGNNELLPPESLCEKEYSEIVEMLIARINETETAFSKEKQDIADWYTVWVHQIKTPIAVMKLYLTENDRETTKELFRIEEYVDMALSYIRLGSEQNDLVIKEYRLDDLIREALRKYAPQFIGKKIRLEYTPTDETVVTDKKWLSCIIEQYISNAVKYSSAGTVGIRVDGNKLTVFDTGIGIAKDDLPRIFEKGYTGENGRGGAKSSGLGLYLAGKAAKLINAELSAESTLGEGSSFSVTFPAKERL